MRIDLTGDQCSELRMLLNGALGELSYEISATDNPKFRQQLRSRRATLTAVRQSLDGPLEQSA